MQEEPIEEQERIEELEEQPPWWKGPLRYILSIFLILIIVLWYVSDYAVKVDPEPKRIPTIEEAVPEKIIIENKSTTITREEFLLYITPNDPVIKQTADKIAAISCDSSKICQAKAIFYFVRDNFNYVSDPFAYEYIKTAKESLVTGSGDCDDASILLANLLEAVGIRARFVFIPNHVYVQASIPEAAKRYKTEQNWINLDATCHNCKFGEIPIENEVKNKEYIG